MVGILSRNFRSKGAWVQNFSMPIAELSPGCVLVGLPAGVLPPVFGYDLDHDVNQVRADAAASVPGASSSGSVPIGTGSRRTGRATTPARRILSVEKDHCRNGKQGTQLSGRG